MRSLAAYCPYSSSVTCGDSFPSGEAIGAVLSTGRKNRERRAFTG